MVDGNGIQTGSAEAGTLKELLRESLPLIISHGSLSLMYFVDRMFLNWYSADATAAALPAGMVQLAIMAFPLGLAMYTTAFVAQYEGAGRRERVCASVWQGTLMAVVGGLLVTATIGLAGTIFGRFEHSAEVQRLEVAYFQIVSVGAVPALCSTVMSCFFTGRGETWVVMLVNCFAAVWNAVWDYVLIFGVGVFPEMGLHGAAWATVSANVMSVILFAVFASRVGKSQGYPWLEQARVQWELLKRMLRYGLPQGVHYLVDLAGFSVFLLIVGSAVIPMGNGNGGAEGVEMARLMARNNAAATNLAFNLNSLAFTPMWGFGTAVMSLVGRRIGEKRADLATRTTWLGFRVALAYMSAFAVGYVVFPEVLVAVYAPQEGTAESLASWKVIREQIIVMLRFVAVYSLFDAMALVFGGAIRGAGDTTYPLLFALFSGWLLMVLPAYVCWVYDVPGRLWWSWGAISCYAGVYGLGMMGRVLTGKWKEMRVIEPKLAE